MGQYSEDLVGYRTFRKRIRDRIFMPRLLVAFQNATPDSVWVLEIPCEAERFVIGQQIRGVVWYG
jgi:hypothetical protein